MTTRPTIHKLLDASQRLIALAKTTRQLLAEETGDDELSGKCRVMQRCTYRFENCEAEINLTNAEARPPYQWLVEISFRETPPRHYLITDKYELVEAYGRKIYPVDEPAALELLEELGRFEQE